MRKKWERNSKEIWGKNLRMKKEIWIIQKTVIFGGLGTQDERAKKFKLRFKKLLRNVKEITKKNYRNLEKELERTNEFSNTKKIRIFTGLATERKRILKNH